MSALPDQLPRPRSPSPSSSAGRRTLKPDDPSLQIAAGLGLAGVLIGFVFFIFACAGFDAALNFCPAVLVLGLASLVLTLLTTRHTGAGSDSSILAGLFLGMLSVLGGVLELTALMHWSILFIQH